jgi:hypothetical protein
MPRLKKAELIEGVVFMPSPLHFEQHALLPTYPTGVAWIDPKSGRCLRSGLGLGPPTLT